MPRHRDHTLVSAPLQNPILGTIPPERAALRPTPASHNAPERNLPPSASAPLLVRHPNTPVPGSAEDLRAESGAKAREALAGMLLRGSTSTPVPWLGDDRPREAAGWERSPSANGESSKKSQKKEKEKKDKKDRKSKKGKSHGPTDEIPLPVSVPMPMRTLPEIEESLRMGPRFSVGTLLQGFADQLQSVS
jgi:hypothetical protein